MDGELARLKVVLEATTAPLKRGMNEAKSAVKNTAAEIKKATAGIGKSMGAEDGMSSVRKVQQNIKNAMSSIKSSMKGKVLDFQVNAKIKVPTEEYKNLQDDIKATNDKLNEYYAKGEKYEAIGVKKDSQAWQSLKYDVAQAEMQLEEYQETASSMENSGAAYKRAYSIPKAIGAGTLKALQKGWGGMTKAMELFGKAASGVVPVIKKTSGLFGALIQKFATGVPVLGRLIKGFTGVGKGIKGTTSGMAGGIKTLLKYGLGIRSIFVLVNKLRSALVEGFKNLAQYSGETNASISMLMSSLTQLKNAFAAAFAPILNIVAPILNGLIQKIISAVNVIGQLTSALTGSGTYIRAKKVQQDYATSIKGTSSGMKDVAKNTDKAEDAARKYQKTLLGFDQINKMDDHSEKDSSGGAADGLGGLSPSDMFEMVEIPGKIKGLAQQIRDAWKDADFTEIGSTLGRKLNRALASIPWDSIQNTANKIAKSIATFLNGFLETTDWSLVGNTLANGITTVFLYAQAFAQTFNWRGLGIAFGNGINGALAGLDWNLIRSTVSAMVTGITNTINELIQTVDWSGAGEAFGNGINTVLDFFYNGIHNFDWKGAGEALSEFINLTVDTVDFNEIGTIISDGIKGVLDWGITTIEGLDWDKLREKIGDGLAAIDWTGIANRTFELIGAAFGGLAEFFGGLIVDAVTDAKKYFADKIEECGGNIAEGILKGIWDKIKDIGEWIKENIFSPFVDGFKKAFGIHSPSTVMAELGGYLVDGLFEGIGNLVEDFVGVFTDIKDGISEKWDEITENASEIWENLTGTLEETWEKLKTTAGETFDNIKGSVAGAWKTAKEKTESAWESIKGKLGDVWDKITGKTSESMESVRKDTDASFSDVEAISESTWEESLDAVVTSLKGMKSASAKNMKQVCLNVKSYLQSILNLTNNTWEWAADKVEQQLGYMENSAENHLGNIGGRFQELRSTISNSLAGLYNIGRNAMIDFNNGIGSVHISLPHIYVSGYNRHYFGNGGYTSTPNFAIRYYARGGFPDAGELFLAREGGPELVGRMGKRNAVANNSQIVEGIKEGVFEAVMDALQAGGFFDKENPDKETVLEFIMQLDSETLYKIVQKGKKKYDGRYHVYASL